ncbi:MAG TPA: hypothetical protein VHJ17_10015 [Thermomonospora sp.]|nr:hypothetical protein [Thermomonospora sp.]
MRPRQWRPRGAALALVPLLALTLAGCGSEGKGPDAKASREADAERARKFAQCMRENGVQMEDPEIGEDGGLKIRQRAPQSGSKSGRPAIVEEKARDAMAKCRQHLPNGGKPPKLSPEEVEKMRQFAKCMRQHGVDMPDPDPNGGIRVEAKGRGAFEDEDFRKAEQACRHLRPTRDEVKG